MRPQSSSHQRHHLPSHTHRSQTPNHTLHPTHLPQSSLPPAPRDMRMSLTPGRSLLLSQPPQQPTSTTHSSSSSSSTTSASHDDPARTAARRKAMLCALTKPSVHRGYVVCRLCSTLVWGPNGRYHIEKCTVLCRARQKAQEEGIKLVQVSGIRIDETLFKKPKSARPKAAKLPGFVISRTVNLENPYKAPSDAERKRGAKTGRKGYVRCLACNAEVYAPNAKHHAASCTQRRARFP